MAAVTKFALKGNRREKKDLGLQAMAFGDVYVASIAMGADYNQSLKAFRSVLFDPLFRAINTNGTVVCVRPEKSLGRGGGGSDRGVDLCLPGETMK